MKRSLTGRRAEDEACRYLEGLGFALLERNHRTRWSEIDIIARKKDLILFVEVRSRTGETIEWTRLSPMRNSSRNSSLESGFARPSASPKRA